MKKHQSNVELMVAARRKKHMKKQRLTLFGLVSAFGVIALVVGGFWVLVIWALIKFVLN